MNVIIANEKQNELSNLDIDIIKNINGVYDVSEIIEMFRSFFYSRMILDVTALKNFNELSTYEKLVKELDISKTILYLPEGSNLCTPNFLGHLIAIGIYNFTTNVNGIKYLLKKPNTLQDVEHIRKMAHIEDSAATGANVATVASVPTNQSVILGVKNVTEHAGATTFIYILKKELALVFGHENVIAIEIDKNDFQFFNDKNMISCRAQEIRTVIKNYPKAQVFLIDLNSCTDDSFCGDVLYLLEPSTIKLNRIVKRNKMVFNKLLNCKVILNKSLLLNNDVFDFEGEAGIKVFYNMPPLDERKRNAIIGDFLSRLGLLQNVRNNNSNKIFGLFRR